MLPISALANGKVLPATGCPRQASRARRTLNLFSNFPPLALESLTLEQLLRFWAHPVRAFFQMRLRVNFRPEESDIPDANLLFWKG